MARNVVFAAPFPADVTMRFVKAAARLDDVRLLGIVHTPPNERVYDDMVRVESPLDTGNLIEAVHELKRRHGPIHRVIGILEAMQVQLAQVRAHFGVPGTTVQVAELFRDKSVMKRALAQAGLPVARNKLLRSVADAKAFVEDVGFPMVLKPPAGMGAKSTFRIRSLGELGAAFDALSIGPHNPILAEEFLQGREFSFESIVVNGEIKAYSISHYLPPCLEAVENPWIQWCCMLPRDVSGPEYDGARKLGFAAIKALGLNEGMTHMEWFQRKDGTLAIGEIAQRPPGANISPMTGYAHDVDLFRTWARAVVDDRFDGKWDRKYAVGSAFLRGPGHGRVVGVTGIGELQRQLGPSVLEAKLPQVGAHKNDSYEGDGSVIVRDPSTAVVKDLLNTIIRTARVYYA